MTPLSDDDKVFLILERIHETLSHLQSKTAVIEDQNVGQFRELEYLRAVVSTLNGRCDARHAELEEDRYHKDGRLGERLQRIETIMWLIGSTVSVLALVLGGGVIVKFIGG
jgi:hypothetical protein